MKRVLGVALALAAMAGASGFAQTTSSGAEPSHAIQGGFVPLDRVVAVIGGDVLLQSDVEEEMRFAAIEPFQASGSGDSPESAMRRLIDRALILRQMKEQQQFDINISDADVEKALTQLRTHLPDCAKYECATEAGWKSFLAAHELTEQEVVEHWKQRLAILRFIDLRFRTGIRISQESVDEYYAKTVVPTFQRAHQRPPLLKDVSPRIQELLLQRQVNGLLQDWLKSLQAEGSVRILDPAYANAFGGATGSNGDEQE